MTAPAVERPGLAGMTEGELAEVISSGTDGERAAAIAELDQRDAARRRAGAARARVRERHGDWEAAAYANYLAAEEHCRGNLLSARGRATGRDPWPMLWMGGEEAARRLASEELLGFWDYGQARPPGPAAFARGQRDGTTGEDGEGTEAQAMTITGEAARAVGCACPDPSAGLCGGCPQRQVQAAAQPYQTAKVAAFAAGVRQRAAALRGQETPAGGAGTVARAEGPRAGAGRPGAAGTVAVRDSRAVTGRTGGALTGAVAARPEPEAIDGVLLWYLVRKYLGTYVAFTSDAQLNLVTAWVFHAVARDRDDSGMGPLIWRASPRLLVTSTGPESGKSTLLDLILILTGSRRGKIPKISAAKIARVLGKYFETVALDEAKLIFGTGARSQELQGILLAGYTPRASYEVANVSLSLFGAVAYAAKDELITESKGSQVGDLLTRSLKVVLRPAYRREVDEMAEDDGELLARALVAWTDGCRDELRQAARDIAAEDYEAAEAAQAADPKAARPRSIQISRPLRACARVVGGGAEGDVNAALAELTRGKAGAQSTDLMAGLRAMAGDWADGEDGEDGAPGRIVTTGGGEDDEWDAPVPALDMEV